MARKPVPRRRGPQAPASHRFWPGHTAGGILGDRGAFGVSPPEPGPRPQFEDNAPEVPIAATRPACVTLITTDDYLPGSIVLGHSLRKHGWRHPTVALVGGKVTASVREELARWWDRVAEVEPIPNPYPPDQRWFNYFDDMFTKLRVWSMEEYDKIVYVDSDVLVTGPIEDLLERPAFAAAPCQTPPDTFNGGVLVLDPDRAVFEDMLSKLTVLPSHDGSDQGFLNSYFDDWFTGPSERRLPSIYNVNQTLFLAWGGWRRVLPDMRMLHFVSPAKPWKKRMYRSARFGYRLMSRLGNASRTTTPPELWIAAWREATGSRTPPWRWRR